MEAYRFGVLCGALPLPGGAAAVTLGNPADLCEKCGPHRMKVTSVLSPTKQKKLADWLVASGIKVCPLCGYKALNVRDVISAPVFDTETQAAQRHALLLAAVECGRCLHIMLFDAVKIGLLGRGA